MPGFDAIAEAFVRLRPKADPNFESEASGQISGAVGRIARDAAGVFAATKIFDLAKAGIDELKESQQVTAQTTLELKNLGGQTDVTGEQVDKLGQQMLDLAGFDDEAGRSAANVLLRFKEITDSQTLTRTEKDAADLAVTMGTDLPSAARTLGLALEDPEKAVRLLRSANVVLDESQKAALTSAAQLGDQQKVNDIILGAIEHSIGGAAKAYGDTLAGAQDKARESIKNAKAELVQGFTPALEFGARAAKTLADGISEAPGPVKELAGGIVILGGGVAALVGPVSDALKGLEALKNLRAGNAAATTTDAAAKTADATATEELAVAEATLATNSAAAVDGLYAESAAADAAGASIGSMVIPIAAAVAATVGLVKGIGEIASGGEHMSVDVRKTAAVTNAALADIYHQQQRVFDGDFLGQWLDRLRDGGQEGVGALKRLRDELAATGEDTSEVDKRLAEAKASQDNLTASTKAGADALGTFNADAQNTSGMDAQKDAAQGLADAIQSAKDRLQALADLASGAPNADIANQRAALNLTDAQKRELDATQKLNAARQSGDTKAIADAEEDLQKAHLDTKSATLELADASAKYKESLDALDGTQDDARQKAVIAHDSLKFFADELGGPLADELQPYIDQLQKVVDLETTLADISGPDAPFADQPKISPKGFATGGYLDPEGAIVGEDGPEYIRHGYVYTNSQTRQMFAGGNTYNEHFYVTAPNEYAAASMIASRLRRRATVRPR